MVDLLVFHLRSDLGRSSQAVGVCLGMVAIGAVVGALAVPRLQRRVGFGACMLAGTVTQGIGLVLAGRVLAVTAIAAGAGLWALGLTARGVSNQSLRQLLTPDALLGRVSAASTTLVFAAGSLGAMMVTRLAAAFGSAATLTGVGAALAVVAVLGALTEITAPLPATALVPRATTRSTRTPTPTPTPASSPSDHPPRDP